MRVLVIHGPNLDRLGKREVEVYGKETLADIDEKIRRRAEALGVDVRTLQSNHEGEIIDAIGQAAAEAGGIVINPGAYGHTSVAIRDALAGAGVPAVEVHITNVYRREGWRQRLVTAGACLGLIAGLGSTGYLLALEALVDYHRCQQGG